jgi:hypothetical protein
MLTGNAQEDARRVLDGIRRGHVYSTVDALAGPAALRIAATNGSRAASMGDTLPTSGPVHIGVAAQAPPDVAITLFRNGVAVASARGARLDHDASAEPAEYRVEVALPDAPGTPPVPWIVSNPIYVGRSPETPVDPSHNPVRTSAVVYEGGPARGWRIEKNTASDAAIDVIGALSGTQLLLRFAMSGTAADSPYVAFVMPATTAIAMYERLVFTARADRPMRASVQLRAPGGEGARWRRSVYLDQTPRTIDLAFSDFRPADADGSAQFSLSTIDSILLVVDTVNTRIGSNGEIQIDDIKYAR